jgi:hypothetical protein
VIKIKESQLVILIRQFWNLINGVQRKTRKELTDDYRLPVQ